jgi:hypothetical protein
MKFKKVIIFIFLFSNLYLFGQKENTYKLTTAEVKDNSYPIYSDAMLLMFNRLNNIDEKAIGVEMNTVKKTSAWNFQKGDKKSWWAVDSNPQSANYNKFYLVPSTCYDIGINCYVFVEDNIITTGRVNQSAVTSIINAFDRATPANLNKGIYQTNIETFGDIPNIDSDPKVIILILDIQDDYTYLQKGSYIAGYFHSVNQSPTHKNSNKAEMFYIDANPLNLLTSEGLNTCLSTVAHEFQHMIHFNYHPGGQEKFFDEAWSLIAEVVNGYSLYRQSGNEGYINNTNRYFLNWNSEVKDYSRAARFSLYLYEQFGVEILKKFVQSKLTSINALDYDVLPALGSSRRFLDILLDWWIANYLNDKTIDSKWGYSYKNVQTVNSTKIINPNYFNTSGVFKLASQYITYNNGKNLNIIFNNSTTSEIKVKALKSGQFGKSVLDIPTNIEFSFNDFGTIYNEITFLVYHNDRNEFFQGPFNYSFHSTGSGFITSLEIKYDNTEPVGFINLAAGDSVAVHFDAIQGGKLDSIRVAIRNLAPINGRVLEFLGFTTKLGGKLYATFTAYSKLTSVPQVINPGGEYPYPQPYPNWSTVNLSSFNILTDKNFVVQFPYEDPYPEKNRVLTTYHPSTGTERSPIYKIATNTWGYSGVTGKPDYSWAVLIRAYVSFGPSGVEETIELLPSAFELNQNYPNPFNPETIISFSLPKAVEVEIKIFDALGSLVRTLINENRNAGKHNIYWNGTDNFGKRVSSGVYFYTIRAGSFIETKKMVLMK